MACSPESGWQLHRGEEGMGSMGGDQGLGGTWGLGTGAEDGERSSGRYSNGTSTEGAFPPRGSRRGQQALEGGGSTPTGRRGGWKKDQEGARRKDKGSCGSPAGEGAAAAAAAAATALGGGENGTRDDERGDVFAADEFRMYQFKVKKCMRSRSHDWTECPYAHPGEKARRRDPRKFAYTGSACPDFRKGSCRRGDTCPYAHGVFECWLHPHRYRTEPCKDGTACARRVCFFAHTPAQLRTPPPSLASPGASLSPSPPSTPQGQSAFLPDSAAAYHSTSTDARLVTPSAGQSPSGAREGSQGRQGLGQHPGQQEVEGACAVCATCSQRWEAGGLAVHPEHAPDTGPFGGGAEGRGLGRSQSSFSEPRGNARPKLFPSLSYHRQQHQQHQQQQQQQQQQQYAEAEGAEQEGEGVAQHRERSHMHRVLEASAARQGSLLQAKLGRPGGGRLQLQIAEAAGEAFGASSSGGGERADSESDTFLGTPFSTWTPPSSSRSSNGFSNGFSTPGGMAHHGLTGWAHNGSMGGPYAGAPSGYSGQQGYAGSPASDLGAVGQGAPDSPCSGTSLPALSRSVSMSPSLPPPSGAAPGTPSLSPPLHYLPGVPAAAYSSFYASLAASQGQGQGDGLGEEAGRASQGQGTRLGQQAMLSGCYGESYAHRPHLPPLAAPAAREAAAGATHEALSALCNGLAYAQDASGTPASAGAPSPGSPLVLRLAHGLYHPQATFGVPMPGHPEDLTAHPGAAFLQHQQHHVQQQPQQPQQMEALVAHGEFLRSAPLTSVGGSWLAPCGESGGGALEPLDAQLQRLSVDSWQAQEAFRGPEQQQQPQQYQQQQYQHEEALPGPGESWGLRDWRMSQSQHLQQHPSQQQQQSQSQQGEGECGGGLAEGRTDAGHGEANGHHRVHHRVLGISGARPPLLTSSSMPVHRVATGSPVGNELQVQGPLGPANPGAAGGEAPGAPGEEGGTLFPRAISDSSHYMGLVSRVGGAVPRPQGHTQGASHGGAGSTQGKAAEWKQRSEGMSGMSSMSSYASSSHRMGFGAILEGEEAAGDAGHPGGSGLENGAAEYANGAPLPGAAPDLEWVTDLVLEEQGAGYGAGVPGGAPGSGNGAGARGEEAAGAGVACHAHSSSSSVWSSPRGGVYSPLF